jgi:hypothetical protein
MDRFHSLVATRENSVILGEKAWRAARFDELATRWRSETSHLSSITDMMNVPSFQGIVGMGEEAVPFLLRLLKRNPYHWFIVLHAITGADPVPEDARGDFDRMTQAWLDWGRAKGYAC